VCVNLRPKEGEWHHDEMPSVYRIRVEPLPVKQEIRHRLRQVIAGLSADEIGMKSVRAAHRLFEQPEYVRAEAIMVFLSLPTELDTSPIVLRAWQDAKRVLAPKVSWNHRRMLPIEFRSLTEDLVASSMGIREPVSGTPFPVPLIDLVIVPGLGFDEYGNRVGRGRGFYDRFLAHAEFQGVACGLALEEQLVPSFPVGPLDRQMDMLITDEGVRRFLS
jgi:5-formyltetrahydrofolate cyclo-ligase